MCLCVVLRVVWCLLSCVVFFLVSHDLQHVIHGSPSTSLYGSGHAAKHGVRVLLRPFRFVRNRSHFFLNPFKTFFLSSLFLCYRTHPSNVSGSKGKKKVESSRSFEYCETIWHIQKFASSLVNLPKVIVPSVQILVTS